ncbi:MAG TPA: YfhO family protein, partial [Thermoanaerobaculia bacterium]|nr:YfhO family protein [Thermoanaerobaculia bacterium]
NGQAELSLRSSGPDLLITATAASRVLLATSIPAWPGWNVETESGRLPIVRVNHAFVGFRLEPGRHEVRLHYRPPLLVPALGACLAGILLAAVLGVFNARKGV